MPLGNFRFFALNYLNDWCGDDGRFYHWLSPDNPPADRLAALNYEAANYYKVSRTFPTIESEERLAAALVAVDAVVAPVTEETVDQAVCDLAARFQQVYGLYAIS